MSIHFRRLDPVRHGRYPLTRGSHERDSQKSWMTALVVLKSRVAICCDAVLPIHSAVKQPRHVKRDRHNWAARRGAQLARVAGCVRG